MLNMSKEFYNYLAKRTIQFFDSYGIKSGEKFILKLDNDTEVKNYYKSIESTLTLENRNKTYYREDDEVFTTLSFITGKNSGIEMIIIPEIDITNAYLTRLRNSVSVDQAIFIVCYNPIDSIAGGTESLQKEGMPFHKDSLIADIKDSINTSGMTDGEKQVLFFDLNNKKNSDFMDMYSLADYASILSILDKGHFDEDDFREFGLFADPELSTISFCGEKELIQRIKDNNKYYRQIDYSIKYGNIDDDLEGDYTENFIKSVKKAITQEHWDSGISFVDVVEDRKKKDVKLKPLKIENVEITTDDATLRENIDFYVRGEKNTASGQRKIHILLFNPNGYKGFEVSVGYSDYLGKNDLEFIDKSAKASAKVSGKKVVINISHDTLSIGKLKVNCKDRAEKFEISYFIVDCAKTWFDEITTCYLIKSDVKKKTPQALIIYCDSEEMVFNRHAQNSSGKVHLEPDLEIYANINEKFTLVIDESSFNDDNTAYATVTFNGICIPVLFKAAETINISITAIKIEQMKLKACQSFIYKGNNKLAFGTNEYNTREDFRENLFAEEIITTEKFLSCIVSDGQIIENPINVSTAVVNAYNNFAAYFSDHDTLPSIAYYDQTLSGLAAAYLNAILDELSEAQNGSPLSNKQKEILKIGTVFYPSLEQIAFSPLHPLCVAYQLSLTKEGSGEEIREDILKKLFVDNLVPFIHDEKERLYKVSEQIHSPNWVYYCLADRKKYKGSRKFVADLTCEKIRDFCDHFRYLFDDVCGNEIIINAINMGDCHNIFKGIVEYYKAEIKKDPNAALSIVINVYDDGKTYNAFEVLSRKSALKRTLEGMGIKEDSKDYSESEFINLLMTKVSYFRKSIHEPKFAYSHIAFIEMDNETKTGFSNMNDIRSGTMLNGLLSGVTSMYYGGENRSYRTGYGRRYNLVQNVDDTLLKLADLYNSMMLVYGTENPYNSGNAICTAINEEETEIINKTYDASNWVVFIDPKVDLNFFKNDQKDIMIIHYSDQHTTSSGYDAITVTRKTEQYENILKEYLEKNNMPTGNREQIRKMIDMFNAVNGDWLLKLISSKSNFSKEKISIQSAIKLALAFFKSDDIIWIPISLEEILRVSGAVGLAKEGGLFSAKNLGYDHGVTSDDLLMFGVEVVDGNVRVHLYPLEVKIGYKDNNEVDKATAQIKQTRKILDDNLISKDKFSLQTKVYRNFIAQLAVISAEKLGLYKIWEHQYWERIVNSEIRGKLLNDDFSIVNTLNDKIGDGIIISFKAGLYIRDVSKSNDVTVIKFLYSDGINYITKSVDDIYDDIQNMSIVKTYQLAPDNNNGDSETNIDPVNTIDERIEDLTLPPIKPLVSLSDSNIGISVDYESISAVDDEKTTVIETADDTQIDKTEKSVTVEKSPDGMRILFGNDVNYGKPLYWFPNDTEKIMHPNTGIIGTMGTGKTQFTKSLILQLVREQHNNPGDAPLGILIFDYKGDYNQSKTDFVEATNAKVYDLYHLPFNPFSITVTENVKPMLPLHIANTFKDTISKCFDLGVKQQTALRDCIMQAYEMKGIDKSDNSTWGKMPPVLDTVFKIYMDCDAFREDSLYAAMSELHEFEIFEPDATKTMPLYDLINGVTVINLAGYDPSIQNLVVAITLDLFYSQMQANGHSKIEGKLRQLTKFILVDEADNFLKVGFPALRKILKEGREFGVGTILSTQFLKHFDTQDDDFAKYIFTWIVHNVADLSTKDVRNLFNTTSKSEEDELFAEIKKLTKHHSFVKFGDSSNPSYIKDRAFWELIQNNMN